MITSTGSSKYYLGYKKKVYHKQFKNSCNQKKETNVLEVS